MHSPRSIASLLLARPSHRDRHSLNTAGFSVTELLAVICILALLATASGPMINSLARHNRIGASAITLQSLLEAARQEAVVRNTYVWLALAESPSPGEPASAILIGSRTGDDPLSWEANSSQPVDIESFAHLERLGAVQKLLDIKLAGPGEVSFEGVPEATASPFQPVSWEARSGAKSVTYTKAIRFTPTGEARVKSPARVIELGLLPANGHTGNAVVLRVAGLTGKTTMFRPE